LNTPVNIGPSDPATSVFLNVTIDNSTAANVYQCLAVDLDAVGDNLMAVFTIFVNPYFVTTPGDPVLATSGRDPGLACVADGAPTPYVQVVRVSNGFVVSEGNTSAAVFGQQVQAGDQGEYQCIANITGADQTAVFNFTLISM